ncbi:hypothetical protein BJ912DRAFT_322947 [Pholiota molesta]|nr:hypothetical protein BJ912DRAFT_322947 [Pholiota molesta]
MRLCPPTFSRSPDHWLIPPLPPVLSLAVVAPQPINTLQIPSLYGLQIPPTHRHSVAPHDTVQCIMSVERIARYCGTSLPEQLLNKPPTLSLLFLLAESTVLNTDHAYRHSSISHKTLIPCAGVRNCVRKSSPFGPRFRMPPQAHRRAPE